MYNGKLVKVMKSDIPYYIDEQFWSCANIWGRWKQFGLPFTGGWAEQPAHIVDAIEAVEIGLKE